MVISPPPSFVASFGGHSLNLRCRNQFSNYTDFTNKKLSQRKIGAAALIADYNNTSVERNRHCAERWGNIPDVKDGSVLRKWPLASLAQHYEDNWTKQ